MDGEVRGSSAPIDVAAASRRISTRLSQMIAHYWRPAVQGAVGVFRRKVAAVHAGPSPSDPLLLTLEQEVIPRLLRAHPQPSMQSRLSAQTQVDPMPRANAAEVASAGTVVVTPHQVRELTQLLIHSGIDRSLAYVDAVREAGVSSERVLMELLSPASEWLGDLWCEDKACFAEVTTALWRLQELLNHISPDFQHNARPPHGARILLCATPGEAHVFGMKVLAEFLRRDGWDVRDEPMANVHELLGAVRHEWYDVIGFSLACDNGVERLASTIREARAQSRNPELKVMVGGAAFNTRPDWVALTGADATAVSAQQAVLHARQLLGLIECGYTV